jgi:hypothetical protein
MNTIKCSELQTPLSKEVLHYVSQWSTLLAAQHGQISSKNILHHRAAQNITTFCSEYTTTSSSSSIGTTTLVGFGLLNCR